MLMTACFLCVTLKLGRKKSTRTKPIQLLVQWFFTLYLSVILTQLCMKTHQIHLLVNFVYQNSFKVCWSVFDIYSSVEIVRGNLLQLPLPNCKMSVRWKWKQNKTLKMNEDYSGIGTISRIVEIEYIILKHWTINHTFSCLLYSVQELHNVWLALL